MMDSHANLASPSTQLILGGGGRGAMVFVYLVNSSPLSNAPLLRPEMANGGKVACHRSQNSEIPFPQGLQVKHECEHELEFQTQGHGSIARVPQCQVGWFFEPPAQLISIFPRSVNNSEKDLSS
jgi:hypothetical protein